MRLSPLPLCLSLATASSPTPASDTSNHVRRVMMGEAVSSDCVQHEIDFVMVEGDALRASVEQEIVEMLAVVGIKVNTRKLPKDAFNAAEQDGDFHLSFSETWGAPYDPHAYAKGWIAGDEGHNQALSGVDRDSIFSKIEQVLKEENHVSRAAGWEEIHKDIHDTAVMLPLWGKRIPTVINTDRLTGFTPGNQQFDYPVQDLKLLDPDSTTVTIAPGAQTGLFQSVGRLDPHTYRPNEFFANNWVYEGLVKYGPFGQILPALAANWDVEEEGEGQRYTFNLREGVTFHDGEEWNCAAAKLNFDHVLVDELRTGDWHGWYGLIDQIESWECESDFVLVVTTKNKYYPFLQELSFIRPLRMLSPASFPTDADPVTANSCTPGWNAWLQNINCAGIKAISGTGPFMFHSRTQEALDEETTVDNEVVFKANSNYWDGAPAIETLIVKRYEDSDAVKEALLDGSLDVVWGSGVLAADDLIALDADETNNVSVFHTADVQNVIILINSGKAPTNDINVRKTIIHAIEKKKIIDDNLGGLFKPVDNVFPRDAPYCDVDVTPRWDFDFEKAVFLNCPDPPIVETVTVTVPPIVEKESDKTLALGLGLGFGLASLLLLVVSGIYCKRSSDLETKLHELEVKEGAVNA